MQGTMNVFIRKGDSSKKTGITALDILYTMSNIGGQVMQKVLVSLPDDLVGRMKVVIPPRQRSKILIRLLEEEVKLRETELYQLAREVESDKSLNAEMEDWDTTVGDGIDAEPW